jgi:hypothetical protein
MDELRDVDLARTWVLQGLWLARAAPAVVPTMAQALAWSLEVASAGWPLPPVGFVADVGHVALVEGHLDVRPRPDTVPGLAAGLAREYDDYVLGRLYADPTFQRAADSLLRYQGRERSRALAFLLRQLCQRAGVPGAILSPALLKRLLDGDLEESLAEGWDSLRVEGPLPMLVPQYEGLISAVRTCGDLLGSEDVFELERGTALAEFGQRLALRQVLQLAAEMTARLPLRKPRVRSRAQQVPTHIVDEDRYPVGGFAAISHQGSIESLLHSQLAYMEPDDRPDLFDIKFVRDELLYYSRDENQFLRRREVFVFALWPDLVEARLKDARLPYQRIVMVLAVLVAVVRRLIDWLSDESLRFEFLFLDRAEPVLDPEQALVEMLLGEQIANGTVVVERIAPEDLPPRIEQLARRSLCHCVHVSAAVVAPDTDIPSAAHLAVPGPRPLFTAESQATAGSGADDPAECWMGLPQTLLETWLGRGR